MCGWLKYSEGIRPLFLRDLWNWNDFCSYLFFILKMGIPRTTQYFEFYSLILAVPCFAVSYWVLLKSRAELLGLSLKLQVATMSFLPCSCTNCRRHVEWADCWLRSAGEIFSEGTLLYNEVISHLNHKATIHGDIQCM